MVVGQEHGGRPQHHGAEDEGLGNSAKKMHKMKVGEFFLYGEKGPPPPALQNFDKSESFCHCQVSSVVDGASVGKDHDGIGEAKDKAPDVGLLLCSSVGD